MATLPPLPPVFTDVPSRTDAVDFSVRADLAWENLQQWLLALSLVYDALEQGLAAPISALQLSAAPRVVGRLTAGAGASEELTAAQLALLAQGDGLNSQLCGFRGLPVLPVASNFTLTAAANGWALKHPAADTTPRTWTAPSNATLALPEGYAVSAYNEVGAGDITLTVNTDTLVLAGTGVVANVTLAPAGFCTLVKMSATLWVVSGAGVS